MDNERDRLRMAQKTLEDVLALLYTFDQPDTWLSQVINLVEEADHRLNIIRGMSA